MTTSPAFLAAVDLLPAIAAAIARRTNAPNPLPEDAATISYAIADAGGTFDTFHELDLAAARVEPYHWIIRRIRNDRMLYGVVQRMLAGPIEPADVLEGFGATYHLGSDRYPYVVAHASPSGKTIRVRSLHAIACDPTEERAPGAYLTYRFEPTEDAEEVFTWRAAKSAYYARGSSCHDDGAALYVGRPDRYRDPHL